MDPTTATILGAFLGALLTGPVTYYFTKRLAGIQRYDVATAKLRATFAPAKVQLSLPRELGSIEVREFFGEEFLLHAAAVEEFRPFVSDGTGYEKAWGEYRKILHDNDAVGDADLRWNSGLIASANGEDTSDFLQAISEKIDDILHFAPIKN